MDGHHLGRATAAAAESRHPLDIRPSRAHVLYTDTLPHVSPCTRKPS